MSERMQVLVITCLTLMGVCAIAGMVALEINDTPDHGHLARIAKGALLALAGLTFVLGQLARAARIESKLDDVRKDTRSSYADLQREVEQARQALADLQARAAEKAPQRPPAEQKAPPD